MTTFAYFGTQFAGVGTSSGAAGTTEEITVPNGSAQAIAAIAAGKAGIYELAVEAAVAEYRMAVGAARDGDVADAFRRAAVTTSTWRPGTW